MPAPSPESATMWQIWQSVLLTLITASALWTARTVFLVRDAVRDAVRDLRHGMALLSEVQTDLRGLRRRVGKLEDFRIALEAVAEAEREQHPGEDRRQGVRRLRDRVLEQLREAQDAEDDEPPQERPR